MNVSTKTITTLLTISICINILCVGFIASHELSLKRHKGAPLHALDVKKYKKKAALLRKSGKLPKAVHEGLAVEREKISALRKDIAEIITSQDVDFNKIAELLREIRTVENGIRDKMEKRFLERLSKMNRNERQEFINKMQAHKNLERP